MIAEALSKAKVKPLIIDYNDLEFPQTGEPMSYLDYEEFVGKGDPNFKWRWPKDEWDAISLNYTSAPPATPRASSITIAARR
jgi:fatty-acyl-CoA synthase